MASAWAVSLLLAGVPAIGQQVADSGRLQTIAERQAHNPGCRIPERLELLAMHDSTPTLSGLEPLLEEVLFRCEDYDGLIQLRLETPASERTQSQRLELAKLRAKAGHFDAAARTASALADEFPAEGEANWIAGYATFHAGRAEAAVPYLQRAVPSMTEQGVADPLVLLGLAALYDGEVQRALTYLDAAIKLAPNSGGAWSALARAHAQAGNHDGAREAAGRSRAIHDVRRDTVGARVVLNSRSHEATRALAEKRYADAAALLDEMLALASESEKPRIRDALAVAHEGNGRPDLAAKVRATAGKTTP